MAIQHVSFSSSDFISLSMASFHLLDSGLLNTSFDVSVLKNAKFDLRRLSGFSDWTKLRVAGRSSLSISTLASKSGSAAVSSLVDSPESLKSKVWFGLSPSLLMVVISLWELLKGELLASLSPHNSLSMLDESSLSRRRIGYSMQHLFVAFSSCSF